MTQEPPDIPSEVIDILAPFVLDVPKYKNIATLLLDNMERGLKASTHDSAVIKMFPSFVTKIPTGNESGMFLALDLGGTNYRVILVELKGDNSQPVIKETTYAIPKDKMVGTGAQLFDYIADTMQDFLKSHEVLDKQLSLGFTFSFPCVQKGLANAVLVRWSKGFSAAGVEGHDVSAMLQQAIDKRSMKVKCVAVVNDTVGTLTSCALQDRKCAIGLIVGTGTNAAYIEDVSKVELYQNSPEKDPNAKTVIINMEWGAFGDDKCLDIYRTKFDQQLDEMSLHPGKQIFEKMISGMYLGELVRLALVHLIEKKLLFQGNMPEALKKPNSFHTKYVSETERDPHHLFYSTHYMLTEDLHVPVVQPDDDKIVRYVCQVVGRRAAYLAATGIACLLNRLNRPSVTVGIDGSLFKFHPKFPERMTDMIHQLKSNPDNQFVLRLSEDGSGKGAAAIAAAEACAGRG